MSGFQSMYSHQAPPYSQPYGQMPYGQQSYSQQPNAANLMSVKMDSKPATPAVALAAAPVQM